MNFITDSLPIDNAGELSEFPDTPSCDEYEGHPGAPDGLRVELVTHGTGSREQQQAVGIIYRRKDDSQADEWESGLDLYNVFLRRLYYVAAAWRRFGRIMGNGGPKTPGDMMSLNVSCAHYLDYPATGSGGNSVDATYTPNAPDDPRGYSIQIGYGEDLAPTEGSVSPGMTFHGIASDVVLVTGLVVDVTYGAAGSMTVTTNKTIPDGLDTLRIVIDNMPKKHRAFHLLQRDNAAMCAYCIPSASQYVASLKSASLPRTQAIVIGDGGCTFCERAGELNATELAGYSFACANTACRFYSQQSQAVPNGLFFNDFFLGRGLRMEVFGQYPQVFTYWNREAFDGILRYLGLQLDYALVWRTTSNGSTISFPCNGVGVYWPNGSLEPGEFADFRGWLSDATANESDNVGVIANATLSHEKRSPAGGTSWAHRLLTDEAGDDSIAAERFFGVSRIGHRSNYYMPDLQGQGPLGRQRIRPRRIASPVVIAGATGTHTDHWSSLTIVGNVATWTLPSFAANPGETKARVKAATGTIHSAEIVDGCLECEFELGGIIAQYRTYDEQQDVMVYADSGGNMVQPALWQHLDNPGSEDQTGDMQYRLTRGDVLTINGQWQLLCVDCDAFHSGDVAGAQTFPADVAYVSQWRREHSARRDWGRFILTGPDGAAVTAAVATLPGMACTVAASAVLPNPSNYPLMIEWLTGTETKTTITPTAVDACRGVITLDLSDYAGQTGNLFFSGHLFDRRSTLCMEDATNLWRAVRNLCAGWFAIAPSQTVITCVAELYSNSWSFSQPIDGNAFEPTQTYPYAQPEYYGTDGAIVRVGEWSDASAAHRTAWNLPMPNDTREMLFEANVSSSVGQFGIYDMQWAVLTANTRGAYGQHFRCVNSQQFLLLGMDGSGHLNAEDVSGYFVQVRLRGAAMQTTTLDVTWSRQPDDSFLPINLSNSTTSEDVAGVSARLCIIRRMGPNAPESHMLEIVVSSGVSSLGGYQAGADGTGAYRDYTIDLTDAIKSLMATPLSYGYMLGLMIAHGGMDAAPGTTDTFSACLRMLDRWQFEIVDVDTYRLGATYRMLSWSAAQIVSSFIRFDHRTLRNGADFHFDSAGIEAYPPKWTGTAS